MAFASPFCLKLFLFFLSPQYSLHFFSVKLNDKEAAEKVANVMLEHTF